MHNYQSSLNTKQGIFFIFMLLTTLFHFYYVGLFLTIYYNCQEKLFYGFLFGFLIYNIYPFISCAFTAFMRYFSLQNGFKGVYKISKFLNLL